MRVGLSGDQDVEVVGVAADARLYDVKNPNTLALYTPALQDANALYKCFVIRGANIARASLKQAVESLGRDQLDNVVTLQYITDRALLQERLTAAFAGFFGVLAMILVGVGTYGVMAYAVAQRQREIGIRSALGADAWRIMRGILADGFKISIGGIVVGAAAALAGTQLVKSLLFVVSPFDPSALVAAPVLLIAIVGLASAIPAYRAATISPLIAMRSE